MKKIFISLLLCTSASVLTAQSKTEIGLHADALNLGVVNKTGYAGTPSYDVDKFSMGLGAYLNHYFNPNIGLSVGLQFVFSQNGTANYPFNGNVSQQLQYSYDYAAIRIPIGITGDIVKAFYYHAGLNLHIDQSKIDNKMTENPMNGIGLHGEAGIRLVLLNLVAIRLGLTAQADNLVAFENNGKYIFDVGARLRVGIRL